MRTMLEWLPPTLLLKEQGGRSQFVLADTKGSTICRSLRCLNLLRNRGRFGRGYFLVAGFIYPRSRVFSPAPCNRCTPLRDCVVLHPSRMTSYLYGSRTRDHLNLWFKLRRNVPASTSNPPPVKMGQDRVLFSGV